MYQLDKINILDYMTNLVHIYLIVAYIHLNMMNKLYLNMSNMGIYIFIYKQNLSMFMLV